MLLDRSLLPEVKKLAKHYGIKPLKRLSQHFVVSKNLILKMLDHAEISREDVVLEVGAGLGVMTRFIAERAKKVIAVEVDRRFIPVLKEYVKSTYENVEIVNADILEMEWPPVDKVVSNVPYSISSPLMFKLLDSKFKIAVFTFQKEFAKRLTAKPDTKDYGRLTVTACVKATVEYLFEVPRTAFWPEPDVESAVVKIRLRDKPPEILDYKLFNQLVLCAFAHRNKKLKNALLIELRKLEKHGLSRKAIEEVLERTSFKEKRAYNLTPWDYVKLTNLLSLTARDF